MSAFIDNGAPGLWRDMLANSPCLAVTEFRPLAPFDSGHSAAAATAIHRKDQAAEGITGTTGLRMDGNAETSF